MVVVDDGSTSVLQIERNSCGSAIISSAQSLLAAIYWLKSCYNLSTTPTLRSNNLDNFTSQDKKYADS